MPEIIENALIIQNDDGFFSKDLTRHRYFFASKKTDKQGIVSKNHQDIIKLSASNQQVIAKTDTDTDTETDSETDIDIYIEKKPI